MSEFARTAPDVVTFARTLVVAEHAQLRSELVSIHGQAMSIVQWTMASFGGVLTAGLVVIASVTGTQQADYRLLVGAVVLFGFALPVIIWSGAWSWLGALVRAERIGAYLRALEGELAAIPGIRSELGFDPLRWERFIADKATPRMWRKSSLPFLGTAAVYFTCGAVAVGVGLTAWSILFQNGGEDVLPQCMFWGAVALNTIGAAFTLFMGWRLGRMGQSSRTGRVLMVL